MKSIHFKAIDKVGNIYCPAHEDLPSFSELGCSEHLPQLTKNLPIDDLKDLKLLLSLLAYMPNFILRFLIFFIENFRNLPGIIGDNVRKMRFGLRGISYSLYFSGLSGKNYQQAKPDQLIIDSTSQDHDKS